MDNPVRALIVSCERITFEQRKTHRVSQLPFETAPQNYWREPVTSSWLLFEVLREDRYQYFEKFAHVLVHEPESRHHWKQKRGPKVQLACFDQMLDDGYQGLVALFFRFVHFLKRRRSSGQVGFLGFEIIQRFFAWVGHVSCTMAWSNQTSLGQSTGVKRGNFISKRTYRYCPLHLERRELGSLRGVLQVSLFALAHAELP